MLSIKQIEKQDEEYMQEALEQANKAFIIGEVPVGAVIVYRNKIIARCFNQTIKLNDPTAHAEILAIRKAAKHLNNYRLLKTQIYVTIEPCLMCAGALIWARIERIVYSAKEPKFGMMDSGLKFLKGSKTNHRIKVCGGVLEKESKQLIQQFFKNRRKQ